MSVPANWQQVEAGSSSVTYAPQGAYFQDNNGGSAFTHGIEFGVAQGNGDLQSRHQLAAPQLRARQPAAEAVGSTRRTRASRGDQGLTVQLANVSEVTGQPEYIPLSTTELRNGGLLYIIGVAPRNEAGDGPTDAFKKVRQNIQVSDR